MGKTWPKTVENAHKTGSVNEFEDKVLAIRGGIIPFKISRTKTNAPYFLPKARTVLVAPAFPLPYSLTSLL